jgi:hypothetical protein
MEIAASLARDKFTMSLIELLQRVRLNRRYHAPAEFERFKDKRIHAASMYAASMCDTPQARHSKV